MFEYAISEGEGTLLDYGILEGELPFMVVSIFLDEILEDLVKNGDYISIAREDGGLRKIAFRPAPPDCQTGQ